MYRHKWDTIGFTFPELSDHPEMSHTQKHLELNYLFLYKNYMLHFYLLSSTYPAFECEFGKLALFSNVNSSEIEKEEQNITERGHS